MNKFLFVTFVAIAFCGLNAVNAADDEYMKVTCIVGDHNKIEVRLNQATLAAANVVAKAGNIDDFRSYMKDILKNIPQKDQTCLFGWIGEQDYTTATAMFVSGITEFKHSAGKIVGSGFSYLYMTTEREKNYDPNYGHFYLSF